MNTTSRIIALAAVYLLHGCGQGNESAGAATKQALTTPPAPVVAPMTPPEPLPYVVELRAVGKTFQGPSEIPSGWTTFKFVNASSMIHFAIIDVPPAGITAQKMSDDVMAPFQEAMDAMNAGDEEGVNAAFGKFPEWIGQLTRNGGPGLLSPGRTGQTTVYLAPGHYIVECYVKSDGVFHSTPPAEGQLGMLLDLTVTDEDNGAPEPEADATLKIRNSGYELIGNLAPGANTLRVDFDEQQALPSFTGNDVHLMRVDDETSVVSADAWMDWRKARGLEVPSPVTFLGGIEDLPAGSHGYFTVDLEPGDYALIAEIPGPVAAGFVLPFTVKSM